MLEQPAVQLLAGADLYDDSDAPVKICCLDTFCWLSSSCGNS